MDHADAGGGIRGVRPIIQSMLKTSSAARALIGKSDFRRLAYLSATVAVAVAAWLVLAAMASPFLQVAGSTEADRLQISNARNRSTPLPLGYAERMSGEMIIFFIALYLVRCILRIVFSASQLSLIYLLLS